MSRSATQCDAARHSKRAKVIKVAFHRHGHRVPTCSCWRRLRTVADRKAASSKRPKPLPSKNSKTRTLCYAFGKKMSHRWKPKDPKAIQRYPKCQLVVANPMGWFGGKTWGSFLIWKMSWNMPKSNSEVSKEVCWETSELRAIVMDSFLTIMASTSSSQSPYQPHHHGNHIIIK